MKFHNAVRAGHFFNLRRKRDARAVNHFEKIGARILNVRASCRKKTQDGQQLQLLHASISRNRAEITSRFFSQGFLALIALRGCV